MDISIIQEFLEARLYSTLPLLATDTPFATLIPKKINKSIDDPLVSIIIERNPQIKGE